MNFSSITGLIFAFTVFLSSVMSSTDNYMFFFNWHAIIIVFGGTTAAAFTCFPISKVLALLKVFVNRILGSNRRNYQEIIKEVIDIAQAYNDSYMKFEQSVESIKDPFLYDAAKVLEWAEAEIEEEKLRTVLENRLNTFYERYVKEAKMFKVIARFPPAFGLLGTTLGMITLLQSLGPGSEKTIGVAMAIALVATLYGIGLANLILIPISENLGEQAEEDRISRTLVVEGVIMIFQKLPVQFIEENLNSFLLPSERGDERKKAA